MVFNREAVYDDDDDDDDDEDDDGWPSVLASRHKLFSSYKQVMSIQPCARSYRGNQYFAFTLAFTCP